MESRSCADCIHKKVCKIYHGEMLKRDFWHKDFRKELVKLQKELADKCFEYREDTKDGNIRTDRRKT